MDYSKETCQRVKSTWSKFSTKGSIMDNSKEIKPFVWEGKRPHYCRRYAFHQKSTDKLVPAPCNSWKCPHCAIIKAYRLQDRIKALITMRDEWYFMTITIDPKKVTGCNLDMPKDRFTKKCWNTALRSFRREIGKFSYLWTMEYHKKVNEKTGKLNNPYPHLHFLIDTKIELELLRTIWQRSGGGYQVDFRPTETKKDLIGYMCKYLKKEALHTAKKMASNSRIWGRSRDLKCVAEMEQQTQVKKESDWEYIAKYMFDIPIEK